ncbi:asparagine synthase (glutamine-hydrolyzing) [Thermodesulfobacteriota bacterium B35]
MCGICGIYNFHGPLKEAGVIQAMTNSLSHRGPDGQGFFFNSRTAHLSLPDNELSRIEGKGNVVFGHRRLSIIDLDGGHQPLGNEDDRVWVTYNGEIYNFKEIRDRLEALGHKFRTSCDTEVIVHAYEEWGRQCVHRFRGMFAFAIWDSRDDTLFLARDRLGIKPLYYYQDAEKIIFASEIKAILADQRIGRQVDGEALCDYFTFLYIPAPKSIFQEIKKLPAGHTLTIRNGTTSAPEQYWDLSFAHVDTSLSENEWCDRVIEKLLESIDIRLVSDVPLGAFLSGGIDSSAVVALMSELLQEPVKTSSIGFRDSGFNELQYAERIVAKYHTDHHQQIMEADAVGLLEDLVWFYDEPFADSSAIPTYLVSRMTRERVTVALSGDGGDENFAGYRRYYFDRLENRLRGIFPDFFRTLVIGSMARVYPKADWLPQMFRAKTLLSNLAMSPMEGYFNSMSSWFGADKSRILSKEVRTHLHSYSSLDLFEHYGAQCDSTDPLTRVQYVDIKTYLVDDILTKVDRASMANSLEVRVPFLDHEFMELAASIPPGMKLRGEEGKYILKKSLEPYLPADILYRKKMGFSIPLAKWFRNDLKELFEDIILSDGIEINRYINIAIVNEMWKKHQSGVGEYAAELWSVLVFSVWLGRYI